MVGNTKVELGKEVIYTWDHILPMDQRIDKDGLIKGSKTIVILGCRNQKADHWIYEVKWGDSKNEKRKELKVKG